MHGYRLCRDAEETSQSAADEIREGDITLSTPSMSFELSVLCTCDLLTINKTIKKKTTKTNPSLSEGIAQAVTSFMLSFLLPTAAVHATALHPLAFQFTTEEWGIQALKVMANCSVFLSESWEALSVF